MQIKKILYTLLLIFICSVHARRNFNKQPIFTIMLDPAGDTKETGRIIGNTFERGITLQYVDELKKILESTHHNIKVYVTRFPGEMIYPLQNANYANRLNVDLYVSINFYQEINTMPKLFLYCFSYGDNFVTPSNKLSFIHYDQAHLINHETTQKWSTLFKEKLIENTATLFSVHGVYTLPFKPLIGIISPAIGIEAGLKTPQDWKSYIAPIAHAISTIIKTQTYS